MDHGLQAMVHLNFQTPPAEVMNTQKFFALTLLVSLLFAAAACTQSKPTVTLTPTRVFHSATTVMKGTGFSKNATALSHLRRPDGTEFPVLPMRTDESGEFTHEIDSLLLSPGFHEVWVEDEKTKTTTDIVRFEVTKEQQ
jgi:hypothetical protein